MSIQSVIDRLQNATGPARTLDVSIAELLGWKKKVETVKDGKTGEDKKMTLWLVPAGDDVGKVPFYTSNIQHAYDLTKAVAPSNVGACTWEDGSGQARIDEGDPVSATTPQLALCIAALMRLRQDSGRE